VSRLVAIELSVLELDPLARNGIELVVDSSPASAIRLRA